MRWECCETHSNGGLSAERRPVTMMSEQLKQRVRARVDAPSEVLSDWVILPSGIPYRVLHAPSDKPLVVNLPPRLPTDVSLVLYCPLPNYLS